MAKRRQTTGLPKKRKLAPGAEASDSAQSLKRKQQSQAEREAEIQRLILWGIGIIVAVITAIIVITFIKERVIKPNDTVATVNGEAITVSEFQNRVRLDRLILFERLNTKLDQYRAWGITGTADEIINQIYQLDPEFSYDPELKAILTELNSVQDELGLRILNDMIEERLVRTEAARQGVTVTQAEIDEQIYGLFQFDPNAVTTEAEATAEAIAEVTAEATTETTPEITAEPPTPTRTPLVSATPSSTPTITPTATLTPEFTPEVTAEGQFTATYTPYPTLVATPTYTAAERVEVFNNNLEAFYQRADLEANMSRVEVNAYFEYLALREVLSKVVIEPTTTSTWVNARHILVETEAEALDIIAALNAGESFADLARANSIDTGSGAQGGELGWQNTDNYITEFADAARTLAIGEISAPVQTQYGFHIIQVRAREERPRDESEIAYYQQLDFADWLEALQNQGEADQSIVIYDIWLDNLPEKLGYVPR